MENIFDQVLKQKAQTTCFQLDSQTAYEDYAKTLAELITKYKYLYRMRIIFKMAS